MADPVNRPLQWSKKYHVYVEKHELYDVLQELMKELIIWKPQDPLIYIRDEIVRISKGVHTPRVFLLGPAVIAQEIGGKIAAATGAKFLTVKEIIEGSPASVKPHISVFLKGADTAENSLRKLLISTISRRLARSDCVNGGYVLYGFPQSKPQALCAQQNGLLPRQVFILLPEGTPGGKLPQSVSKAQMPGSQIDQYKDYFTFKDVASVYNFDICKTISYERWKTMKKPTLEAELLGSLVTVKPSGSPLIPKILLMGPPGCGKSTIAEHLAAKFQLVNIDWMDIIRGKAQWVDEVAQQAQQYLIDLSPISEDGVKEIISKKLDREDCQKKGWILQGFPETVAHAKILDELCQVPNRRFLLSCSDRVSINRMAKKKKAILNRHLPKMHIKEDNNYESSHNIGNFPYSEYAIQKRCSNFNSNVEEIIQHFGSSLIIVDASQSVGIVCDFVAASVLRPPNIRF